MEAKTLQDLVQAAASLHRDRTAVTFDGGTDASIPVSLRYSELTGLANELTHLLREQQNTNRIALYCRTDVNLPVWILGILQVPAAYVPLDPDAPAILSARIVHQCVLEYCVVQRDLLEQFQAAFCSVMRVEECAVLSRHNLTLLRLRLPSAARQDSTGAHAADGRVVQGELAYVLHTSGTTGVPKTVRVPHKCIVPNILHLRSLFQMTADDVVFLASPLTFDPSVVDMFLALSSGARLLIVPAVIKKMPSRLSRVLFKNHNTTFLQATPTLLARFGKRLLQEEVLSAGSSLRVLVLGGEACPSPGLLSSWRQEGNGTLVYNIYGVTEVSCWACCYRLPETHTPATDQVEASVPLGAPLRDTTVEVRDEHGCLVTEGEGQVFIGGEDRVCLLDDEVTAVPGTMRATGDWVRVRDAQLYYLGRRDRLVKRHGQRVHLDALQQVLLSLPQVECGAVGLYKGSRLVAFVVASTSGEQTEAPTFTSVQNQLTSKLSASTDHQVDLSDQQGELSASCRGLQRRLAQLLPSYSVPDTVLLVPDLPLTSHGKVDMSELMKIYRRQRDTSDSRSAPRDVDTLRKRLLSLWKDTLGLAEDDIINEDANFLFSGGDSLQALALCDDIAAATGATSSGLLEVVLDGSLADVLHHVAAATPTLPAGAEKRRADPLSSSSSSSSLLSSSSSKRERTEPPSTSAAAERLLGVGVPVRYTVVSRAGQLMEMQCGDADGPITRTGNAPSRAAERGELCRGDATETGGLVLRLSWSSDTGRCVDASPVLLVQRPAEQRPGDQASGGPRPGDQASGGPRPGDQASGGPGPGDQASGGPRPGDQASGGPRPGDQASGGPGPGDQASGGPRPGDQASGGPGPGDQASGGPGPGEQASGGPGPGEQASGGPGPGEQASGGPRPGEQASGGPRPGEQASGGPRPGEQASGGPRPGEQASGGPRTSVFIGSHSQRMQALDLASGRLLWERVLGGRVESSAAVSLCGGLVVVGCYDGCVYFLCALSGETRWTFQTGDAVKSSPTVDQLAGLVIVGSHDGHVYALDPQARRCVWKRPCGGGAVFSSPRLHAALRRLYVATLGGRLLCLSPDSGAVLWTHDGNTPFFSSPSCSPDHVFIGCVDGNICCFSHQGATVWQFSTRGPVFSSPCVTPDQQRVLCGSHDGCLYCLNCADGSLAWSFQTSGRVYASPTVFHRALRGQQGALVGVASTDGTLWVLDGRDGALRASLSLPGELFSSPVVWERSLVVGCRNDFVYCVEMMEVQQSGV